MRFINHLRNETYATKVSIWKKYRSLTVMVGWPLVHENIFLERFIHTPTHPAPGSTLLYCEAHTHISEGPEILYDYRYYHIRAEDSGMGAGGGEIFFAPPPAPSKSVPAKNLYTKSERISLNGRVTWASSERVNLYSSQIMIVPGGKRNLCNTVGPRAPLWISGPR